MTRTVVLLSGGLDSTALAYWLGGVHGHDLVGLTVDYGQKHRREITSAVLVATTLRIPLHRARVSLPVRSALLEGDRRPIPSGAYEPDGMAATVVPGRNALLLSLAAGVAASTDADAVAIAVHAGDHAVYPDCRPVFLEALEPALSAGIGRPLTVLAPFATSTKAEIAKLARACGAPIASTWSCYRGGDVHCGDCGTCVERRGALGPTDPTIYAERPVA